MCGQVILGTDKKKLAADEELDEDGYPIEAKVLKSTSCLMLSRL